MITKKGKTRFRQFDLIVTNPPFAGDIAADSTLAKYELAFKPTKGGSRKKVNKLSRDKMFIERCLDMLAPKGRMAIVLPRGILKNYGDEYIRRHILMHAKIVGVVGLGSEMFKPFTNTKTCVVFIQKRQTVMADLSELNEDPEIVFCVTEQSGKNKSGNLIMGQDGQVLSDLPEISEYLQSNIVFEQ